MKYYKRRDMLCLSAVALASGYCPFALSAAQEADTRSTVNVNLQELDDGVFVLSTPYANVLGLQTGDGVLLVDGVRAGDTPALLAALDRHVGAATVEFLYNSHWHWDHTGSNEALRERGARIIAHENTRLWLTNDFFVDWEARHYAPRPASALPTDTWYDKHSLDFGDETVESGLLFQAHTDGDIYVKLTQRNVLATGDLVMNDTFPLIDPVSGGWIGGLTAAHVRLLELADDRTRIIPGCGALMSRADLQQYCDKVIELRERIYEFARQGKSPEEMLAEGVANGFEAWGDPVPFVMNVYPGLGRHYREISGVV